MRSALISIENQPRDDLREVPLSIAGRSLARRQLDFALAAGCERVIALGDGAQGEAIALRHAAEGAGARFQTIRDAAGLLGLIGSSDELLVLAAGLLPESRNAIEALSDRQTILTLPAGPGIVAGFERIDMERSWAGALVIPGNYIEKLAELSADSDPQAALLRIALQARLPERQLPETEISEGYWTIPRDPVEAESGWLRRNAPPPPPHSVTGMLAHLSLLGLAGKLLQPERSFRNLSGIAVFIMALALVSAWFGASSLGFALITIAAFLASLCGGLVKLQGAPFNLPQDAGMAGRALPILVDVTLLGTAVMAMSGDWLQRLFPPLMLLAGLYASRLERFGNSTALLADRGLLALLLAVAAALSLTQPVIMLLALALVVLKAAQSGPLRD